MKNEIVAQTTAFYDVKKMKITVDNREILLVNVEGSFYAVDNKCTHMGGSLYDGNLDGHSIICPRHGTAFDVRTGKVSRSGKIAFLKINTKDLHTYPVEIEGTNILVGLD